MVENNSQFKLGDDGEYIDALTVEKPKKKGIVPLWWRITQGQGCGILTGIIGAMIALSCLGVLLVVTGAINLEPILSISGRIASHQYSEHHRLLPLSPVLRHSQPTIRRFLRRSLPQPYNRRVRCVLAPHRHFCPLIHKF